MRGAVGTAFLAVLWPGAAAHADYEIRGDWVDITVPAPDGGAWLSKHSYVGHGTQNIAQACVGRVFPGSNKVNYQCFGQGIPAPATHGEAFNTARVHRLKAVDGGVLVAASVGSQSTNGACACRAWIFRMDDDGSVRWSQALHPAGNGQAKVVDLDHRPGDPDAYLATVIAEPGAILGDPRSVRAESVLSRIDVLNGQIIDSLRLEHTDIWWPASPGFPEFSSRLLFQVTSLRVDAYGEVLVGGFGYFHLSDPWVASFDRHGQSTYAFAARYAHPDRQLRSAWRARYEVISSTPYRRDLAASMLAPHSDRSQAVVLTSTEEGDEFGQQWDLAMVADSGHLQWRRTLARERWDRRQIHAIVRGGDGGVVASLSRTNSPAPLVSTSAAVESIDRQGNHRARIESTLPHDPYTIDRTYHSGLNLRPDGINDLAIGSLWLGRGRFAHDEVHARSSTLKHFSCSWTRPSSGWVELGPAQWATPVFRPFQPRLRKGDWLLAAPMAVPMQWHQRPLTQRSCP